MAKVIKNIVMAPVAPSNKNVLWIDTSSSEPCLKNYICNKWIPASCPSEVIEIIGGSDDNPYILNKRTVLKALDNGKQLILIFQGASFDPILGGNFKVYFPEVIITPSGYTTISWHTPSEEEGMLYCSIVINDINNFTDNSISIITKKA